jgi:hypothetical protein
MRIGIALSFLVAAGCGDSTMNNPAPDFSAKGDMAVGPNQDLKMETFPDLAMPKAMEAIVTTSSFMTTGTLNTVALSSDHTATKGIDNTLDQQNVVSVSNGKAFVLDQTHGSVRVYDPTNGFKNPVEIMLGAFNPHAVVALPTTTKAYVSMYGAKGDSAVAVIDWSMPSAGVVKSIAIPVAQADTDGKPEASDLYLCGQYVYVGLQDLDENKGFGPSGPGRIAAIDTKTDALDTASANIIALKGPNPNGFAPKGTGCDIILVGDAGNQFGDVDGSGGIEEVDLSQRKSNGMLISDTDLMGHPGTMSTNVSAQIAFAVLTVNSGAGSQPVAFDYNAKKLITPALLPVAGFVTFASVSPDGQLFIGVASPPANGPPSVGLYIGAADGKAITSSAIDLGQAPYSIAYF